jgi:hypothetical protein
MKKILMICVLCDAGALASHAQTLETMAEQLAALQVLQNSTTRGYSLMTDGLDSIGQITADEFQMHQTYFSSLAAINPSLTTLIDLLKEEIRQIKTKLTYWEQQNNQP